MRGCRLQASTSQGRPFAFSSWRTFVRGWMSQRHLKRRDGPTGTPRGVSGVLGAHLCDVRYSLEVRPQGRKVSLVQHEPAQRDCFHGHADNGTLATGASFAVASRWSPVITFFFDACAYLQSVHCRPSPTRRRLASCGGPTVISMGACDPAGEVVPQQRPHKPEGGDWSALVGVLPQFKRP